MKKLITAADKFVAAVEKFFSECEPDCEALSEALATYKAARAEYDATKPPKASAEKEPSADGMKFAEWVAKDLVNHQRTPGTLRKWALCFDDLVKRDGYTPARICEIWKFSRTHTFYSDVVRTPLKLRKKERGNDVYWIELIGSAMDKQTRKTSGNTPQQTINVPRLI